MTASKAVSGNVHGGQQPVSGATLQMYAVGTGGDGTGATALFSPAISSTSNGNFTFPSNWQANCPTATSLVYLVATGGNPGLATGGSNPQLALMAALGSCDSVTATTYVSVNEITTVAAVYALAPYMTGPSAAGSVASGTPDASSLASAFAYAAQLANPATGQTPGTGLPPGYSAPTTQIDTIADILAPCIDSSGGVYNDNSACGILFYYTTPSGVTPPTDAITALYYLAGDPTENTSYLYPIATATGPYQPTDSTQPADFSITLIGPSTMTLTPVAGANATSTAVYFPTTAMGSSASYNVILGNQGPAAITVQSILLGGPNPNQFQTTGCPSTIAVSGTCQITVTFAPISGGIFQATLLATTDASNSPLSVSLYGSTSAPTIAVSPSSANLQASPVGTPSTPQPITISNTGSIPLLVGAISLSGTNANEFSVSGSCPAQIAPGGNCIVTVHATPTSPGLQTASLTILSNASPAAPPVALTATGTGP